MLRKLIVSLAFASSLLALSSSGCDKSPSSSGEESGNGSQETPVPMTVTAEPTEMLYSDSTRTAIPCAKDPTVIRKGKYYYMYYSQVPYEDDKKPAGINKERANWHTGIARSTDLIHWTRVGDMDLVTSKGAEIGYDAAPCVKVFDGVIHLFYQRSWAALDGTNEIWHATSEDGIRFVNTHDEPVYIPDNTWSTNRAIDAEVYKCGDKMMLMYATRDLTGKIQQIGMAEAPYGCDYGPDKWTNASVAGPVIKPVYGWEGKCIEAPTVLERDGVYYFFYAGSYNNSLQQLGLAVSTDGRNFTRVTSDVRAPGLFYRVGETGTWNSCESGHPGVFEDWDGQVYLFYQGKDVVEGTGSNYSLSVLKLTFTPANAS